MSRAVLLKKRPRSISPTLWFTAVNARNRLEQRLMCWKTARRPAFARNAARLLTNRREEMMARLKELYIQDVVPKLMKDFQYKSIMEVPKVVKIVVNMGLGEAIQ